jgi:hypothetical protein
LLVGDVFIVVALFSPVPAGNTTWIDQLPRDTQVNSRAASERIETQNDVAFLSGNTM